MSDGDYSLRAALEHLEHIAQMKPEILKANASKTFRTLDELANKRELTLHIFHESDLKKVNELVREVIEPFTSNGSSLGRYKKVYMKITEYIQSLDEQARELSGEMGPLRFVNSINSNSPRDFIMSYIETVETICSMDSKLIEDMRIITIAFTDFMKGHLRHGFLSLKVDPTLLKLIERVFLDIRKETLSESLSALGISLAQSAPPKSTGPRKMTRKLRL
jgi:hypothetical protein